MGKILIVICYLLQSTTAFSQTTSGQSIQKRSGGEFYVGTNRGKRLISVNLLTGVKAPGVYHIPEKTPLPELFAYAGGLLPTADLENVHIRGVNKKSELRVSNLDFNDLIKNSKIIYQVQDKDTILIERNDTFDRTLKWVSLASIIVSIVSAVVVVNSNK